MTEVTANIHYKQTENAHKQDKGTQNLNQRKEYYKSAIKLRNVIEYSEINGFFTFTGAFLWVKVSFESWKNIL